MFLLILLVFGISDFLGKLIGSTLDEIYLIFYRFFQVLDDALNFESEIPDSHTNESDFVCSMCSSKPIMIDKSIDNGRTMKTRGTQYNVEHFSSCNVESTPPTKPKSILKVKISKPKSKPREMETNTEVSFPPKVTVSMSVIEEGIPIMPGIDSDSDSAETGKDLDASFDLEAHKKELDGEFDSQGEDEEEDNEIPVTPNSSPIYDSKFIVFWSCLLPLLQFCIECRHPASIRHIYNKGTMIMVSLLCERGHCTRWYSQPLIKGMAAGNLLLAASLLYTGNTFQKIKQFMDVFRLNFFSERNYSHIQKTYLFPAVHHVYTTQRELIFENIREENELHVTGDGRCDSPGYSAKYGTYTLMNSSNGQILDFRVIHSRVAGNSARMELLGLKTLLESFNEKCVEITSLTTDRHIQVRCYMKKECPEIKHQFDVWHVGKNIKKKLAKAAKKKTTEQLNLWIKAIINHFWWCCASCSGDPLELKEKWVSILYHIRNKHRWEGSQKYKECAHEKLTTIEQREKPWLREGTPAYLALERVITDRYLLADLRYLTSFNHTGTLEVFHSLYNKYCPKRLHFHYGGMVARSQLAVMDHNSSVDLGQAKTKTGQLRYKQVFSRVTQSWVVKKIKAPKDKCYIDDIVEETLYIRQSGEKYPLPNLPKAPTNIAPSERPNKEEAIDSMRTRFKL